MAFLAPREGLAARLPPLEGAKEKLMLQSAAKSVPTRALPIEWIAGTASVGCVAWLLTADSVPPVLVYLVQLFLAF